MDQKRKSMHGDVVSKTVADLPPGHLEELRKKAELQRRSETVAGPKKRLLFNDEQERVRNGRAF